MTSIRTASRLERTIAASVVAAALLVAGSALAQTNSTAPTPQANPAPPGTTTGSAPGSVPQAPVGHRQPRAADIPAATEKPPAEAHVEKLQEEGSKKLNICRGC